MKKQILVTSLLSVVGRSVGFFIPLLIGFWFGTTPETDGFFWAYGLLVFVALTFGNVFETVVVPFVTDFRGRDQEMAEFIGGVLLRSALLVGGVLFLGVLVLKPLLKVVTGFSPETMDLVFRLVVEMSPMLFLMAWTDTLNGVLNAKKYFHVAALSPAYRSVAVIFGAAFLKEWFHIHAIALAYVLGEGLRLFVSYYHFRKKIARILLRWKALLEIGPLMKCLAFQMTGLIFINLISLVDQSMASWLGPTHVSTYSYAERLRNVLLLLFLSGTAPVIFSYWANRYSLNPAEVSWEKVKPLIWKVFFITAGVSLGIFLLKDPLTALAFQRGAFPHEKITVVASLWGILLAAIPFQTVSLLGVRLLVIFKRNNFYTLAAFVAILLNILLNYAFMIFLGIYGIALATLLVEILLALLIYWKLRRIMRQGEGGVVKEEMARS